MPTYVAMLRGVNVGSHNRIKMPALVELFAGLGHADVATYIQSGNVVFKSRSTPAAALEREVEDAIKRDLGCDVAVLIRTKAELAKIVRTNPFLRTKTDPATLHVTFLATPPARELVRTLKEFDAGPDEARVVGRDVYLHCPNGYGNTKLNPAFIQKRLQAVSTTRNWKTVTTLLELAG